jgi:hypothetical protein
MPELYTTGTGQKIYVHKQEQCRPGPCSIHNPSDHHMKSWPTHWREDRYLMERICAHGIGHPDPDHISHLPIEKRAVESIHGCDGDCLLPHIDNPMEERESNP